MKDLGKGLLQFVLLKVFMNPIGITVIITLVVICASLIFFFLPSSNEFNLDNPDENRDILDDNNSDGSFFASCQADGDINKNLMSTEFASAGVFSGESDMFVEVAEKYDFDPVLLSAIALHETGYGTSDMVRNKNNPGGLFNSSTGTFYEFNSLEEGLDAMTSNLAENYYGEGLFTIEEIGSKYAPVGADNDPNNLNTHWIPTITGIVNDLGGLVMHCEEIESQFFFPVQNPDINSDFGYRIHPIEGVTKFHGGTDFNCDVGDPIYASNDGEIVYNQFNDGGFGNMVIMEHPGSIFSVYAHLNETTIDVGDSVQQGEQVGACGSTGSSTGAHLHFEIQLNEAFGQSVDPMEYLPAISEN